MRVIGLLHPITLKKEGKHYILIAGFFRFCSATELGWKTIKARVYTDISQLDMLLIEIIENSNRKNFASYEFYVGLYRLKTEYEKAHPETQRGRYIRHKKCDTITDSEAVMLQSSDDKVKSFVNEFHELLGLAERTMFKKIRICVAIGTNKFNKNTINLLKKGKISQNKLLKIFSEIDKKEKIQKEESMNSQLSVEQKIDSSTEKPIIEEDSSDHLKQDRRQFILEQTTQFEESIKNAIADRFFEAGERMVKANSKSSEVKRRPS